MAGIRSLSKTELHNSYIATERTNALLRAALMDVANGAVSWQPEQTSTTDGTTHRYGWGRLDAACGGYLIYCFGAPGQSNFVRVEYLDDAEPPKQLTRQTDTFRAEAIAAAKDARDRLCALPDPRWSAAEAAYEEDCRRCPNYPDGSPRKPWHALGPVAQDSWYRDHTPREYRTA